MRACVAQVWGWDEEAQAALFDARFQPERWQVILVGGEDVGVLVVEERTEGLWLAEIQLLPAWQGRGIGGAVIETLIARAAGEGRPLTLRVLHVNERAQALYGRLGFERVDQTETHTYMRRLPPPGRHPAPRQ